MFGPRNREESSEGPLVKGFFAFPSTPPSIPPTLNAAVEAINRTQQTHITNWESLSIGGTYIIDTITSAINEAHFFCADVTGINPNVMFELGFAIATDKRIWLVRDESYVDVRKEFDQLRVLTTIGFRPYTNSDQLIKGFFEERPDQHLKETIEDVLFAFSGGGSILLETEVRQTVSRCGLDAEIVDDAIETLVKLSFLGLEIEIDQFAFSEEARELKQNAVLSARFTELAKLEKRYQINPAFRTYLKVSD